MLQVSFSHFFFFFFFKKVGPWKKNVSLDSEFQGLKIEVDEKKRLEELANKNEKNEEIKPRSNSQEVTTSNFNEIQEQREEALGDQFERDRANSIPQPIPSPERKLGIGVFSTKGTRKKNEDAHVALVSLPTDTQTAFFAVFDGHGGKNASHFCKFLQKKKKTKKFFQFFDF